MKSIRKEMMNDFNFLGKLKTSPKRTRYGFIKSQAEFEENEYHHTLYIGQNKRIDKVRKLKTNSDFLFLDEETILLDYQKNKDERQQLKEKHKKSFYYYKIEDKHLEKAFTLPFNATLEEVIDDNHLLISAQMTIDDHILYEGDEEARASYVKDLKKHSQYEDIEEIPYYFNGKGFTTDKKKQVFIYQIQSGEIKPIEDKAFSVGQIMLTHDHRYIYYTGKYAEKVMTLTSKIYRYDIQKDETKTILDQDTYNIVRMVDMDKLIVFAKDMNTYGLNQNPDIYQIVDKKLILLSHFGESFGNSIGTDCRLLASKNFDRAINHFYFVSTIDDHSEIKVMREDGHVKTFYTMDGSIDGLIHMYDHMVIIAMHKQGLQELYQLNFDGTFKQITSFNQEIFNDYYVAKPQEMIVKKPKHDIKGFALLPEGYNPKHQYSMILDIHGGPKTVYGHIYYHEMQYWVNQGYIVIYANPRGSDGKGNVFADIRGRYGSIDYQDLMDFVDQAIETYDGIDTSRMYVTGGSYGGFMTNWIVGHTNRFKAAVTQRSISNWISFYGTSDIGYYFASDQTDGHPILDLEKLYEQSPIKYAMKIETPLLFIHSDKDYRCPMEQAQQLYAILKTRGVDTELIWFKDETHELSRSGKPQARIKRLTDITEWFKRYH